MKNNENSKNLIKISLLFVAICVVFSFGINTTSAANTSNIYVNSQGNDSWNGLNSTWTTGTLNGPKATIKNATTTVKNGGTVYIANGTYNENNIQINNDMTIIGASQKNTIINGGKAAGSLATIFIIPSGVNITISDLTIENGYNGNDGTNNGLGGAINNKGTLTLNSVTFKDNEAAEYGGAIYNTGNLNVNTCTFNNNIVTDKVNDGCNGGAIYNTGKLTVNGSTFNNNTSTNNGGAIFNNQEGRLIIRNSTFTKNISSEKGYGGAIGNDGSSIISDSIFTLNSAAPGGAIANMGSMNITSCTFNNNFATMFGGAVLNAGNLNITGCNFNYNNANQGNGGAIGSIGQLTIGNNNTFTKNIAYNGGAIFNADKLTITKNNTFTNNQATSNGGAIYNSLFEMDGQNYVGNLNIEGNIFKGNTASYGGAIENDGILTVKTSTFTDNTASKGDGGAIYSLGNLILTSDTFTDNSASNGNGGALAFEAGISLQPSAPAAPAKPPAQAKAAAKSMTVESNAAIAEKESNNTYATVTNCRFTDNNALNGGAIENEGNMTVIGCTFESNKALNGDGGAIFNGLHPKKAVPVEAKAVALLDTLSTDSTYNSIYLAVSESSFVNNNAINGDGGAIATNGEANINFSRIIGNGAINGSSIYNSGDLMDASLNWWGTNMDPSNNVYGNVTVTPWLILKMIANPNITRNGASQITAELLYDSNGVYHDPANGKLPDGIPVTFAASEGTFNPTIGILVDGQAKSLFTANANGKTTISTTIDNQTVSISITSDQQKIKANSNNLTISTKSNIKTIPMQHTGVPIAGLILAILTVIGGTIIPRKR